jgi:tetratricopeptide (TPR) repeat protein
MSDLSGMLAKGNALARANNIAGARAVFEQAAAEHAGRSEPWVSLAAIHGMQGNFADAVRCATRAVELAPRSLQAWVNLGNAAQACGQQSQAAEAFTRARALPGCPPDVALRLGLALAELGRWPEAEEPLREYCKRDPDHREATLTLARLLANKGDIESATAITEAYYSRHRDDAEALFFKALLRRREGRAAEARDIYERLDRRHPRNTQILMALCEVCSDLSDAAASIAYARAILELEPQNVPALLALSGAMIYRDAAEARNCLNRAIAIAPDDAAIPGIKGELLEFEGDKRGAWECVRPEIENGTADIRSANVAAAVAPTIGKTDEIIEYLERMANRPELSRTAGSVLHFSLASLCDKARQYDRAFEHAVLANKLKNVTHDDNALSVQVNALKAVYSAGTISSLPRSTIHSDLPLFIVGMPRSGTSLLEQILSCHSRVHARGETSDIPALVETIPYYPDGARNLTQEKLDAWATTHINRLREMAPEGIRFTDKLPGNFLLLGLISQLFPATRILNCRRDPRDVCLSNFMTDFGGGHQHSYNLESLARVCKLYQELMEHWKRVLPLPILDVRYEELTADPRAQVERILEFCGLEWEEACLSFHQSKRLVMTASYDQVRQPLHKRSVGRWKNYERHLEPVSRILGLHDDSYP